MSQSKEIIKQRKVIQRVSNFIFHKINSEYIRFY